MTIVCRCGENGVVVAVYSEKASTRRLLPGSSSSSHEGLRRRKGYEYAYRNNRNTNRNRRAELLDYSRHLRASSAAAPSASAPAAAPTSSTSVSHKKQTPRLEIVKSVNKSKQGACSPTCCGKWKLDLLLPTFFKANKNRVSTTTKIKSLLQVGQKKGSFMSKLFATLLRKRH